MELLRLVLGGAAVLATLGGATATWSEAECAQGIANIAEQARACQEQAAGAGRDISGELVTGDPVCSQVGDPPNARRSECPLRWTNL